ncbi:DUF418 domain-containing protein [Massilia sp. HP4]|uniref:DUF418 domain-containing protein n=1 Tax=Massilia sp. HP4 TaxID=2562316 RepID=UPI0010C0B0C8|nr:DUF418 domain-containing protein [Massilia sp. HP4]
MSNPQSSAFSPVLSEHRLDVLDVLRGFALVGICVANVEFFNRPVAESGNGIPAGLHGLDWLVAFLVAYFVSGKFWTIFSLLFGMGFALMLERAGAAERPFLPAYGRRIAVLGLFGLLHYLLLWSGDILISYAIGALALVLMLFARGRWLIVALAACFLVAQAPGFGFASWLVTPILFAGLVGLYLRAEHRALFPLVAIVPGSLMLLAAVLDFVGGKGDMGALLAIGAALVLLGLLAWGFVQPRAARPLRAGIAIFMLTYGLTALDAGMRHFAPEWGQQAGISSAAGEPTDVDAATVSQYRERTARSGQEKQVLTNGSHAEAVAMRLGHLEARMRDETGFVVVGVSVFLVGLWFVRSGVIANAGAHLPLFRRLAVGGIGAGVGLGLLSGLISTGRPPGVDDQGYDFANALMTMGSLPASLGYMAAIVLALHGSGILARVRILAPFGRMALSNYLMQSLVLSLLFYAHGLGLWGMGRTGQVGIALLLCVLQIGLSHWWLARFQYGPLEWVWRALTYLKWPAMRRAA